LSCDAEALVNLEGAINIWVIDETLPANGCAWFLAVYGDEYYRKEQKREIPGYLTSNSA
jgi:hypothetical protein